MDGAAPTAPKSDPDLEPQLHFPGKNGICSVGAHQNQGKDFKGFGNRPCHVSFYK